MPQRNDETPEQARKRRERHAFFLLRRAGIGARGDRIQLAKELFSVDEEFDSFNDLTDVDLDDLIFALTSWEKIQQLRLANGILVVEAERILKRMDMSAEEIATHEEELDKSSSIPRY